MAELMMYDGKVVNIFNLTVGDVDKEVIIRGACRINRFLGQTKYQYPVASHLIGGWKYLNDTGASEILKKQWLIHEAFESYSGVDLPSPLKAMLPDYKIAETRALKVIAEAFGVDPIECDEIKALDRSIMVAEALVLMPNDAYWYDFAVENNISILDSDYVLKEENYSTLKYVLEDAWSRTFDK